MQIELFEVLKKLNRLESSIDRSLLVNTTPASPSRLEPTPQYEEPAPPHTEPTPQHEEPAPPQTEPTPQYKEPVPPQMDATAKLIVVSSPCPSRTPSSEEKIAQGSSFAGTKCSGSGGIPRKHNKPGSSMATPESAEMENDAQ